MNKVRKWRVRCASVCYIQHDILQVAIESHTLVGIHTSTALVLIFHQHLWSIFQDHR